MASHLSAFPEWSALPPISQEIWGRKYRFTGSGDLAADMSIDDTFARVARAAASVETGGKKAQAKWERAFHEAMSDFGFLPGGRILAGAGTGRDVTLFNCFVLGKIEDDLGAIFDAVKDAALTMQAGGGIGHDFSTLRPKGAVVKSIGADASGPVSFMDVWDSMCRTIMSAGQRRGAMMATLRCDHPDIEEFIAAKADPARLRNFNLSVLVTDAFMDAVKRGAPFDLVFEGKAYKTVEARALWNKLMRATYEYAEPGVIFIDRINAQNNLAYCETIAATNPCGEQPLPPFGACLLGSINLASLVDKPFTASASIDLAALESRVAVAVRLLDNVIDRSGYPLKAQAKEARQKRRIGLGITGLADALIFCGQGYGSDDGRRQAAAWMSSIQNAAYSASVDLAREKGAFDLFDAEAFTKRPNIMRLDQRVQKRIAKHGLRNGCLTSIAPTGTISLLAGNVSSGIEPVFDFFYDRRVLAGDGSAKTAKIEDFAFAAFRKTFGEEAALPPYFVTAGQLSPNDHLAMQAALQPYVDSAISKTINCPETLTFDAFRDVYQIAYAKGLKGCTAYRPNPVTGAVLTPSASVGAGTGGSADLLENVDLQEKTALPVKAPVTAEQILKSASGADEARTNVASGSLTPPSKSGEIFYMTKPLERDDALQGMTYKIKWPASPHALYVTINDIVRDGRRRPFEIFINTKNLEHYAWTVALTRMISAVFRRGGDVTFVAEELKAVFDPEGGCWMEGAYVPSLLAAIGNIIERHMIEIGFLEPQQRDAPFAVDPVKLSASGDGIVSEIAASSPTTSRGGAYFQSGGQTPEPIGEKADGKARGNAVGKPSGSTTGAQQQSQHTAIAGARHCPRCGERSLYRIEGCWACASCQYSHCG